MFIFEDVRYKEILDIPVWTIKSGGVTVLEGQSGSGKSTVLKLLNKMVSPSTGTIYYKKQNVQTLPAVSHRRKVVMLNQQPVIFPGTIRDNLTAGFRFQQRDVPSDAGLNEMMGQLQLVKTLNDAAFELSGGERQRLALGRILLLDAETYLFDEPSSALDEETEDMIFRMLTEQAREHEKTVVLVTHSKKVARKYGDEIFQISGGQLKERKRVDERNY